MAKKNSRSADNSASSTTAPAREPRRAARAATRTAATTPQASIAELDGSPAVVRDSANEMPAQAAGMSRPTYNEIAEAAYQRYLQRGGQHGYDFDDWVEAERSLRERK